MDVKGRPFVDEGLSPWSPKWVRILVSFLLLWSIMGGILSTPGDAYSIKVRVDREEGPEGKPPCYIGGENRCRPDGPTTYQWTNELLQPSANLPSFLPLLFQPLPPAGNLWYRLNLSREILKPPEGPSLHS